MSFSNLSDVEWRELPANGIRVICSRLNDGYVYGRDDAQRLYRSTDGARTWAQVGDVGLAQGLSFVIPSNDGEILLVGNLDIFRTTGWGTGSISRASVLTSPTTAYFVPWGVDFNGSGKVVATHYGTPFTDSRYVWLSEDYGNTWAIIRDLDSDGKNDRHIHFAIFDPYNSDRIYISHHEEIAAGSGKSVEYSDNNGSTWTPVHCQTVLRGDGVARELQPTTGVAVPEGILLGSDDHETGLYKLPRGCSDVVMFIPGSTESGAFATRSFAAYSQIDPYTGHVYTCWKQQTANGRSYIIASNGVSGDIVYAHPNQYSTAVGTLPGFYYLAFTDDEILASAVFPSESDGVTKVWWAFRAKKSVYKNTRIHSSSKLFAG
jgi:hypothetical protein